MASVRVRRPGFGSGARLMAGMAVAALLSACASSEGTRAPRAGASSNAPQAAGAQSQPRSPLHRAAAYWGERHERNPGDAEAAHNYAVNLKAMGAGDRAMQVLAAGHRHNPSDARIASEYGRLALEAENLELAKRLLAQAESATREPDWKLLSAQGTLHAKLGEHERAQTYFKSALAQKPDSTSILNNLAMSHVLEGNPDEAEKLLRQAIAKGDDAPRLRQNLALVLGLQGRFDEGQQIAKADLPPELADANMGYLRNMVRTPAGEPPSQARPAGPPAVAQAPERTPRAAPASDLRSTKTDPDDEPDRQPARDRHAVAGWTATVAQEARAGTR